jgi:hypothetical protein
MDHPAERTKQERVHIVPLSRAAIELLGTPGCLDALLFPPRRGKHLGSDALSLKKLFKIDPAVAVLHGFRGSARTWGGEQVNCERGPKYSYQALEYVLSHRMKTDKVKVMSGEVSAYAKETFLAQRRVFHDDWPQFVTGRWLLILYMPQRLFAS